MMNQEWKEWVTIQRSFTCICCGYIAFQGDSCHVCGWQLDCAQEGDPELTGGANGYSLRQAQANLEARGIWRSGGGPRASQFTYPRDPTWRPVAEAIDLSDSPARAREVFEQIDLAKSWMFEGAARSPVDYTVAVGVMARRLADLGMEIAQFGPGSTHTLTCLWHGHTFRAWVEAARPSALGIGPVSRDVITALGPERWGECLLHIGDALSLDLARSSPLWFAPEIEDHELTGPLAYVDWIQYWSAPLVARYGGLDALKRGPFARVDALAHGAAGVWLARDPFREPMSRAAAAAYLGMSLPKIHVREAATARWLVVPWP